MVEMSVREKIARAIADFVGHHPWPVMAQHRADLRDKVRSGFDYDVNEPTQNDCLEAADAVLEALREPGLPAQEAGAMAIINGRRECFSPARALEVWTAMIDHARNDGKE